MVIFVSKFMDSSIKEKPREEENNNLEGACSMAREEDFDERFCRITQAEHDERDKEFIRKLANDYIHFKIHGRYNTTETENKTDKYASGKTDGNDKPFCKTAKTLRKVSMELERSNSLFFDRVCNNLNIKDKSAETTFKLVSEEVLSLDSLNWGRVVSLFTFGGKVAEWFWETQQKEKIDEVEEWLAESLSGKKEWIDSHGGWVSTLTSSANKIRAVYNLIWKLTRFYK